MLVEVEMQNYYNNNGALERLTWLLWQEYHDFDNLMKEPLHVANEYYLNVIVRISVFFSRDFLNLEQK